MATATCYPASAPAAYVLRFTPHLLILQPPRARWQLHRGGDLVV